MLKKLINMIYIDIVEFVDNESDWFEFFDGMFEHYFDFLYNNLFLKKMINNEITEKERKYHDLVKENHLEDKADYIKQKVFEKIITDDEDPADWDLWEVIFESEKLKKR